MIGKKENRKKGWAVDRKTEETLGEDRRECKKEYREQDE
jgi:hypothetical protein